MLTYFCASSLRDIIDGKDIGVDDVDFSPDGLYVATKGANFSPLPVSPFIRVSPLVFDPNK